MQVSEHREMRNKQDEPFDCPAYICECLAPVQRAETQMAPSHLTGVMKKEPRVGQAKASGDHSTEY